MTVSQTDMVTLPDRAESEGGEKASLSSTDIGRERGREREAGRERDRERETCDIDEEDNSIKLI